VGGQLPFVSYWLSCTSCGLLGLVSRAGGVLQRQPLLVLLGLTDRCFFIWLLLDLLHLDRLVHLGGLVLSIRLATHARCSGTELAVPSFWPVIIQHY